MPEETPQKRSLSEISHLFLSSVRDKQTNGAPRPQRIPPGQKLPPPLLPPMAGSAGPVIPVTAYTPDHAGEARSVDLTAEELAHVSDENATAKQRPIPARRSPPVTAVLGAHLNGRQFDRVKEYARHLSAIHGRIGLIELDASEFRLMSFEAGDMVLDPDLEEPEAAECYDVNEVAEALEEMNCDVDHWLLLVPNPRTPEARALLRSAANWVLLSTCDHDGVVSSYRMLKGLAESYRPRLSLALLDGIDATETQRVYRKMSSVCQQFLNWKLEDEEPVRKSTKTVEHLVLCCRPSRDKNQIAAAPQWGIVGNFLQSLTAASPTAAAETEHKNQEPEPMRNNYQDASEADSALADFTSAAATPTIPAATFAPAPTTTAATARTWPAPVSERATHVEIIDLPASDAGADTILAAILGQNRGELIECPVRAPMAAGVRLAITRDRRMVLLAVAREGLSDLKAISQAYRWVSENRALIGMAIPQFAIDASIAPRLRLLVDHADVSADVLHSIMHSEHVTVQAYRKCRWGGKTGMFLEAA
jgi:hypothetical protein